MKKNLSENDEVVEMILKQTKVWSDYLAENHYDLGESCKITACLVASIFSKVKQTELRDFLICFTDYLWSALECGINLDEQAKNKQNG